MSENKIFTIDIDIRFRDLDAMGHVNNAVYFTYFEYARLKFFENRFSEIKPSDFSFILANTSCNFILPVKLSDSLLLQAWVSQIGNKSFHLKYKLVNKKDNTIVYADAESIQVCYDYSSSKSMPVPDDLKRELLEYLQ